MAIANLYQHHAIVTSINSGPAGHEISIIQGLGRDIYPEVESSILRSAEYQHFAVVMQYWPNEPICITRHHTHNIKTTSVPDIEEERFVEEAEKIFEILQEDNILVHLIDGEIETASHILGSSIAKGNFLPLLTMSELAQANDILDLTESLLEIRHGNYNMTAFHSLAYSEAKEIPCDVFSAFVDAKADPYATDSFGDSILHLLIRQGRQWELAALLEQKNEPKFYWVKDLIDSVNYEGRTPLHAAVLMDQLTSIDALIKAGADVNCKSLKTKLTPLHYAVADKKAISIITRLLETKGIFVNAKTAGNETALDFAVRCQANNEITAILLKHGAERGQGSMDDYETEDDEDDEAKSFEIPTRRSVFHKRKCGA